MAYLQVTKTLHETEKAVIVLAPAQEHGKAVHRRLMIPKQYLRKKPPLEVAGDTYLYVPQWWLQKYAVDPLAQKGVILNWVATEHAEMLADPAAWADPTKPAAPVTPSQTKIPLKGVDLDSLYEVL